MEEDKGEKQRALLASLTDERVRLRALSLMRDAARRFTSQDKRVVEGFHVASMAAEVFRNLCMRALQLSLSKLELGALLLHIYGLPCIETGAVNSQDFIKQFVAMGVRERNEEAAERKKREEANKKTAQDSKSKEGVNKGTTRLEDFTFDEADEARAVEKLTTASVRFDRGSTLRGPQTAAFDAFQASVLTPSTLKDGLKVLLGVSLSRKELNALFLRYSRELSGSSLTGVWFFRQFLKLGEERRNALKAEEDARLAAKKAMQLETDLRAKYENVLLVADLSFTPSDEVSAKAKLRKAARTYEGGGMEELYSSNSLSPHQLRAVLRRELRLSAALTAAEIGAISSLFPSSHQIQIQQQMKQPEPNDNADLKKIRSDFSINGATFVAFFLRLVAEEKRLVKSSQMVKERQRTANEIVRDELLKRKTIDGDSNSTVVNFDFTEADRSATLLKLSNFAGRYDKHSLSAVDLTAFEGLLMSPTVLRQTLLKVAGMRLNAKELGVLMKEFSRSGEESVVRSSDFLAAFARAGIEQRKLWAQARLHIEEHRAAREKEKERKRAQLEETRQSGAADFEFDAKDEVAAEEKIRRAALSYDRLSTTAPSLNIFQAGLMSPAQLRSNLRKVFGVYLSSKELGALFRKHDPKCEGFIHSRIFLRAFLTLSQELRAPLLRRRPETCPDTLHLVTEDPKQNDENIIDWKYDAEHFDAACALLELKLLRADTDQFQVFNGMQMTALQVKEAIQRALNVLLSALELGALMGRLGARPPSDAPSSSMPAITIDSQVLKALLLRLRQSARNKEAQREQSDRRQQREKDAAEASREALLAQQRQRMAAQCSYLEEVQYPYTHYTWLPYPLHLASLGHLQRAQKVNSCCGKVRQKCDWSRLP